ncbi:hypothetical protein ACIQ7N_00945 [Lysinibacillus sp. NPDC095746]
MFLHYLNNANELLLLMVVGGFQAVLIELGESLEHTAKREVLEKKV